MSNDVSHRKLRVFISSVQKELELERAAVAALIATDPFLLQHCEPVLFEQEPPPPRPSRKPYLDTLKSCQAYVLMIGNEYGGTTGELSATHEEYRLARKLDLPSVVFLRGRKDDTRSPEVGALIAEAKQDGFTYRRFNDRKDLEPEMQRALLRLLAEEFELKATPAEADEGQHLIEAASTFESAVLTDVPVEALDEELLNRFNHETATNDVEQVRRTGGQALQSRGLAVRGPTGDVFHATMAAWLLFGGRPADRFPQCEILVDAYDDTRVSGRPKGQTTINAPLPFALEQALKFIDDHTFHPRRVAGLNNLRLDEYPVAALREALVNAVAHRSYEDRSRKVFVRVFSDRVEIASPGYPPQPLTLAKLRKGGYRPCSRNPLIAQTLATLGVMEQRGSGFARMRDAMLNHGLEAPLFGQQDGFFIVTLPGPAGNYDRLKVPAGVTGQITPAIEAQLNKRQKKIMIEVQKTGAVTSGWCRKQLGVTYDTANRDLLALLKLGLLMRKGRGPGTRYEMADSATSAA
jgi:predicted HTH transcriptional regulator